MSLASPRRPTGPPSSTNGEARRGVAEVPLSSPLHRAVAVGDTGDDEYVPVRTPRSLTPPAAARGSRSQSRLQNSLRVASTRFSTTKGVLSDQVNASSATVAMDDYVASVVASSTEIERHASAMGFHSANGSFLSVTEEAVHQACVVHPCAVPASPWPRGGASLGAPPNVSQAARALALAAGTSNTGGEAL